MQLSFKWAAGAVGVLLFAATISAQQAPPAAQGQAPAAPAADGQRRGGGPPAADGQAPARGQGAGAAGARAGGGGRGFTNLTVLPRDIPQPQLIAVMQGFEAALGVTCVHCHADPVEGTPNDRASDIKPAKKTARLMMLAARDFNAKLTPADLGKQAAAITPVMCGTCHRGKAIPDYVQPPPPPARGGGAGAGGRAGAPGGGAAPPAGGRGN